MCIAETQACQSVFLAAKNSLHMQPASPQRAMLAGPQGQPAG